MCIPRKLLTKYSPFDHTTHILQNNMSKHLAFRTQQYLTRHKTQPNQIKRI